LFTFNTIIIEGRGEKGEKKKVIFTRIWAFFSLKKGKRAESATRSGDHHLKGKGRRPHSKSAPSVFTTLLRKKGGKVPLVQRRGGQSEKPIDLIDTMCQLQSSEGKKGKRKRKGSYLFIGGIKKGGKNVGQPPQFVTIGGEKFFAP